MPTLYKQHGGKPPNDVPLKSKERGQLKPVQTVKYVWPSRHFMGMQWTLAFA